VVPSRMQRDPRSRVVGKRAWFDIVLVGAIMAAAGTLAVMDWALPGGLIHAHRAAPSGLRYAQTMAFTTLVFDQLFNTFNARFPDRSAFHHLFANRWLWAAVASSVVWVTDLKKLLFRRRGRGPLRSGRVASESIRRRLFRLASFRWGRDGKAPARRRLPFAPPRPQRMPALRRRKRARGCAIA
jgi:Cation transporting ATPase, C-terminus